MFILQSTLEQLEYIFYPITQLSMNNHERLHQIISDLFEVPVEDLNDQSSGVNIERWDSMGIIDLVTQIEEEFSIKFELMEVEELKTIGVIKNILEEKGVSFS